MKEFTFLQIDYGIQLVIGFLMLMFLPIAYGLIFLLPFGIWQNVSSLIMVYVYKDQKRIPHLNVTAIWLMIFLIMKDVSWVPWTLGFSYIILLPACIGLWYFLLTKKDYRLKESGPKKHENEYV